MYQHPFLTESLVRDHVAEIHRSRHPSPTGAERSRTCRPFDSARKNTGWFLVHVGLRLAIPRTGSPRGRMAVTSA